MYSFQYKDEESLEFATAKEAIKFFNQRGWGMHNWVIRYTSIIVGSRHTIQLTLPEFNIATDLE